MKEEHQTLSSVFLWESHSYKSEKMPLVTIKEDIINESIALGKKTLHAAAEQKPLGIVKDKHLNFQRSTKSIIKKSYQKISAFIRVAPMTDFNKKI